jgi:light-harvesting complex 1 alpha chain
MATSGNLTELWRVWTLFDPRTALLGLFAFLLTLALLIHFIVLESKGFNWLAGAKPAYLSFLPPTVK